LLALFKNLLPLTSFGGAPYGVDEAGVVKCVVKAGRAVIVNRLAPDDVLLK